MTTLFYNAKIVDVNRCYDGWLMMSYGVIDAMGPVETAPTYIDPTMVDFVDCQGDYLMPGVIDAHVHFRDPGLTQKGDIETESRAAVAGGVTTIFDMPNTNPATTSAIPLANKNISALGRSFTNFAFFLGATNDNFKAIKNAPYGMIPGIKLFLGSSTGNMLVNDPKMLKKLFAFKGFYKQPIIAVHAEDEATIRKNREIIEAEYQGRDVPVTLHSRLRNEEACVKATEYALQLAHKYDTRLHLCHVSTAREAQLLSKETVTKKKITAETCPQYLLFTQEDLETRGARLKCNPAIKSADDRAALIKAVKDRRIDIIATDHAPHLPADKEGDLFHAASGMPGIQFSLVLMLTLFKSPITVARLMCHNPARIFGVENRGFLRPDYNADIVRVRKLAKPHTITDDEVISKCGWTPYAGCNVDYEVISTWVNGNLRYDNGQVLEAESHGKLVTFKSK